LGELVKCETSKSILPAKSHVRPDIRLLGQFPKALTGHVQPRARTCPASQPYPTPYLGSKDLTQTCPAHSPDMSDRSALSGFLAGFQRPNPDMSDPQPGLVRPISLILGYPILIRHLSRVPETVAAHVRPLTRTCSGF
jgi:hypothetical protein